MKYLLLLFTFFLLVHGTSQAQLSDQIHLPYQIDLKKIEEEKLQINYTLNEMINIIEDSIRIKKTVIIPPNCTEFEKALFTARRTQHNDSQLVAIKFFKTLLEFECYRSRGEELYLKLLLGSSVHYIGAPLLAYQHMSDVFPEILSKITNTQLHGFFLDHYASILIKIDSIHTAKEIFESSLLLYQEIDNKKSIYNTKNNLGYIYSLLGDLEHAKILFKQNQKVENRDLNPIIHAFSFGNYGSVLLKENKPDSALHYFKKELELLNAINTREGLRSLYTGMGNAFKQKKLLDSASFYFKLALKESTHFQNAQGIVNSHIDLMKIYSMTEDTPELSILLENYLSASDSLRRKKQINDANIEAQIATFLKIVADTEVSRRKNDELANDYKDLTYTMIALSLVVFFLVLVIYFRNNNRKKLKAKNLELKAKNLELKNSYQVISESNDKNEVLLKELHHRVKNNLQIISSLFNLQLNASKLNYEAQTVFKDAQNRIHSISLVHKKIYQSNNVDNLDFEAYVRDFSDELIKVTPNDVDIDIQIHRNPISIDYAVPLGLILNELFTNSLKHAISREMLKISVRYETNGNKEKFIYTDNGVGVTNIEVMKSKESSIGFTLIQLLGKQLEAKIEYKEAKKGEHGFWLSIEGNFG